MPGFNPPTATPGNPRTPHAFYKTATDWPGMVVTTTRQHIPYAVTIFEQPGDFAEMPVRFDAASGKILNPNGQVYDIRVSFNVEADVPTVEEAIAYSNSEHGTAIATVTDMLNPVTARGIALAMSEPRLRLAVDVQGALGEIIRDDIKLGFTGAGQVDSLVRPYPLFGGATQQQNGADLGLYLPRSSAAAVRVTSASLFIKVVSSTDVAPGAA